MRADTQKCEVLNKTFEIIGTDNLNDRQIFPDLDTLQQMLSIPPVNTGKELYLTGTSGMVTDDIEGLNAYQNENGKLHLVSGVEFQDYLYRGQVEEKLPCVPSLGRIQTLEERLLAICRVVAFEEALEAHPFIKKSLQFGIHVDIAGLAQHYGLSTDMLDITGSFEVASFFATSRWDSIRGYVPVCDSTEPGVIYRVTSCILEDRQSESFHLVGWQPLPRPEQQRAFAIQMKPRQNFVDEHFTTECAYFRQNAAISYRIWKKFDEGRALLPNDPAAQLSARAKNIRAFTRAQIECAWSRFEAWECRQYLPEERAALEESSGMSASSLSVLTWEGLDVETRDDQLNNMINDVFKRVRYRRTMYL